MLVLVLVLVIAIVLVLVIVIGLSPPCPDASAVGSELAESTERPGPGYVHSSMTDNLVERTPWWFVSVFIHAVIFAVAALIVAIAGAPEPPEIIVVTWREPLPSCTFDPPEDRFELPEIFEPTEKEIESMDRYRDTVMESETLTEYASTQGESGEAAFESAFNAGTIGPAGETGGDRQNDIAGREIRRKCYGPTHTREIEAVDDALGWLARHQGADGAWRARDHLKQCTDGSCTRHGVRGDDDHTAGLTGLALLAFLGSGYTHRSPEFGGTVTAAARYLIAQQSADGCVGPKGKKYMYDHAIAALALSEAFALTGNAKFGLPAQRAIDFLVAAQNPGLGWRYVARSGDNDTSVTQWAVMALKSAEMAGLHFPAECFDGALSFLDRVTYKEEGSSTGGRRAAGYVFAGRADVSIPGINDDFNQHPTTTAISAMCRMFVTKRRDSSVTDAISIVMDDLPRWKQACIDFYYWYAGSLALFQHTAGKGATWDRWYEAVASALLPGQNRGGCAGGSWEPDGRWCFEGGRVYATAVNALTLEVHYRYSSVFGGR